MIIYGRIRTELADSHCSRSSVHSARLLLTASNSLPVTLSCTYCIYKQPTNTHTHTPSYTPPHPPASSPSAQMGFSITERRWDGGGGGGPGGGAAVGRKLFCHWHPTVILWLITPALRLNWDASIPGSMVLADMYRSASHIAPEVLQTSGDNVSLGGGLKSAQSITQETVQV